MAARDPSRKRQAATLQRVGVAAPTLALSLGLAIAAYVYFPTQYEQAALESLESQAQEVTSLVAYTVAPALEFDDQVMAHEVLSATRDVEGLRGIVLENGAGDVFAIHGEVPQQAPRGALRVRHEVETSVAGDGVVVADFSTDAIREQVALTRRTALTGGAILVLMGLLLSLWSWFALGRAERLMSETRAAEAASQAKSEFIAHVSHEVRTPLNGVIGTADVLSTTELTTRQQRLVDTVRRSSLALLAILDDILDYAKAEAGEIRIERVAFDLRQLVDDVVETFRATAEREGLWLRTEMGPDISQHVEGDPLRLRQVLGNLVGNALKFTERGGVTLRVSVRDERLCFAIEDTGIGIDASARERLFDAFTQADVSTSRRYGGTGLGLSISARLVQLMDGMLDVESEPGRGSTFFFDVPHRPAGPVDASRGAETSPPDATPVASAGAVLVAEDNPVNREVVAGMLDHLGVAHQMVSDGEAAVAAVRARPGHWSLVLMDYHMPGLDGLEAATRIRELGVTPEQLRIVAVTAEASPPEQRDLSAAGIDDWVAKPLRIGELRRVVERWAAPTGQDIADGPDADGALIDEDTWAELSMLGGPRFVADLIQRYDADASAHLDAIDEAVAREDLETVRARAHALRGSSGFVAARAVSRRAGTVEDSAAAADVRRASEESARLREALHATLTVLRSRIETTMQDEHAPSAGREHGS